jgi:glyoxylase I family protein
MLICSTLNFGTTAEKEYIMAQNPARHINGYHHAALRVRDFAASVRFYEAGLGCVQRVSWGEGNGRAVMLDLGNGNLLEIFAGAGPDPRPEGSLLHLAFRTGDCDAALSAARAAGARVTKEPTTVTLPSSPPVVVRVAFCMGPDGEVIEFFQSADV